MGEDVGVDLPLVRATVEVNEQQPYKAVEFAERALGDLRGKRVAVLGLAFKPNTDDMRGAVSIKIVNKLVEKGAVVVVYDPKAMPNAKRIFGDKVEYAESALDAIRGADCAIFVTEWDEFKSLKLGEVAKLMKNPIIIDGRRIFDPRTIPPTVKYYAIGLGWR